MENISVVKAIMSESRSTSQTETKLCNTCGDFIDEQHDRCFTCYPVYDDPFVSEIE